MVIRSRARIGRRRMAAPKRKPDGLDSLDALLDQPAFVAPKPVEGDEPQFRTVDAKMGVAEPEPAEPEPPEPEPVLEAAPEPVEEQTPVPAAPKPVKAEGVPEGWYANVDEAPQDGKPVFLMSAEPEDGARQLCEAVWRNSREFDRRQGRWVGVGFWAVRNCAGLRVPWTPVAWRPAL